MALNNFPVLNSERLKLRQIMQEDLENIFNGLSHPEVIKYYGVSYKTIEETQGQIDWYKQLEENKTGIYWAICSFDNSIFYGAGGLNNIDKANKKAEIGFWLLPEFWKKGLMQEAFPLICKYGFNHLNLHRIEGFVESKNLSCKKSIEKMEFVFEGTMRDCEIKNNKFVSIDMYSKLKTD